MNNLRSKPGAKSAHSINIATHNNSRQPSGISDLNREFEIAFSAAVRASQMTPTSSRTTQKNINTTDMPEENIMDEDEEEEALLDKLLKTSDDRENISDEEVVDDEVSSGGKSTPSDSELEEESETLER